MIYLQWGVYSNSEQVVISNAANVTIRGGCIGNGTNDYSGTNSTLTKTGGEMRIVAGYASTVTVEGVTISDGYFSTGENYGAGLLFQGCAVTLTNCVVRDNMNTCTTAAVYGGGLYASGGSLTVVDSCFLNNALRNTGMNNYGAGIAAVGCSLVVRGIGTVFSNNTISGTANPYGGAIYATNGTLTLTDATLVGNWLSDGWYTPGGGGGAVCHEGSGMAATITDCLFASNAVKNGCFNYGGGGGAIYLGGATGVIERCAFTNNSTTPDDYSGQPKGGAMYARNLYSLQVVSCEFQNNQGSKGGGTLYVTACSNIVVDDCMMDAGGISAGRAPELVYVSGSGSTRFLNSTLRNNNAGQGFNFIAGAGAELALTNCLVAGNASDGLWIAGGTAMVANCTIAANTGWGITNAGALTVKNSIIWANAAGGIITNATSAISYTGSQELHAGPGNMNADPLFVDVAGGDYHLQSLAGSYRGVDGVWTNDPHMSPCIDAGEPGSVYAQEPKPNGGRVNLGAYGNTFQASLSSRGTAIAIW